MSCRKLSVGQPLSSGRREVRRRTCRRGAMCSSLRPRHDRCFAWMPIAPICAWCHRCPWYRLTTRRDDSNFGSRLVPHVLMAWMTTRRLSICMRDDSTSSVRMVASVLMVWMMASFFMNDGSVPRFWDRSVVWVVYVHSSGLEIVCCVVCACAFVFAEMIARSARRA